MGIPAEVEKIMDDAPPPDLYEDLKKHPEFLFLISNVPFCRDLYDSLCNTDWEYSPQTTQGMEKHFLDKLSGKNVYNPGSFRGVAGRIAELRNEFVPDVKENYMSFYCSTNGGEGVVRKNVESVLNSLGWFVYERHRRDP